MFANRISSAAKQITWDAAALAALIIVPVTVLSAQSLFGPGKFQIEQSDDRFSTSGLTTRTGTHNRVTNKTVRGGIYGDYHGIYLDPIVVKRKNDGVVTLVGFLLHHVTTESTMVGDADTIGIPKRVVFLMPDGKLITADVKEGDRRVGSTGNYDRYTRSVDTEVTEGGIVSMSAEDMATVAHAQSVTIHIEGERRDWTIEPKIMSKNFLPNVRSFYEQEVAPGIQ